MCRLVIFSPRALLLLHSVSAALALSHVTRKCLQHVLLPSDSGLSSLLGLTPTHFRH